MDHVLTMQATQVHLNNMSQVKQAAMRAEAPYKTLTMDEIRQNYTGPPKYMSQRDAPMEIPPEVVRNLFLAMD